MNWIFKFELRGKKVIILFTLSLVILGAALGTWLLTEEWSFLRRLFAGATGGLGAALIIIMSRWMGAYSETRE